MEEESGKVDIRAINARLDSAAARLETLEAFYREREQKKDMVRSGEKAPSDDGTKER